MMISIALAIRKPIRMDGFIDNIQEFSFARIKVEINSMESVKPDVLIQGLMKVFWQSFIYENVYIICFHYGRMGHKKHACWSHRRE